MNKYCIDGISTCKTQSLDVSSRMFSLCSDINGNPKCLPVHITDVVWIMYDGNINMSCWSRIHSQGSQKCC